MSSQTNKKEHAAITRKGEMIKFSGSEDHNKYSEDLKTYLRDTGLWTLLDDSEEMSLCSLQKPEAALKRRKD